MMIIFDELKIINTSAAYIRYARCYFVSLYDSDHKLGNFCLIIIRVN